MDANKPVSAIFYSGLKHGRHCICRSMQYLTVVPNSFDHVQTARNIPHMSMELDPLKLPDNTTSR